MPKVTVSIEELFCTVTGPSHITAFLTHVIKCTGK